MPDPMTPVSRGSSPGRTPLVELIYNRFGLTSDVIPYASAEAREIDQRPSSASAPKALQTEIVII